jgi:hypothetical protein
VRGRWIGEGPPISNAGDLEKEQGLDGAGRLETPRRAPEARRRQIAPSPPTLTADRGSSTSAARDNSEIPSSGGGAGPSLQGTKVDSPEAQALRISRRHRRPNDCGVVLHAQHAYPESEPLGECSGSRSLPCRTNAWLGRTWFDPSTRGGANQVLPNEWDGSCASDLMRQHQKRVAPQGQRGDWILRPRNACVRTR